MTFYNSVLYKGQAWRYVFTNPDPALAREIGKDVIWNIVDMYYNEDTLRDISGDDYEARIDYKGSQIIGMFSGENFEARIQTDEGKSGLGVLLIEGLHKGALN